MLYILQVSPKAAPDASTFIDIEFVKGVPVKMTNKTDGTIKVRSNLYLGFSTENIWCHIHRIWSSF